MLGLIDPPGPPAAASAGAGSSSDLDAIAPAGEPAASSAGPAADAPPEPFVYRRGTRGGIKDKARKQAFGYLQQLGVNTHPMRYQSAARVLHCTIQHQDYHLHYHQAQHSEVTQRMEVIGVAILIPIVCGTSPGRALRVRRSIVVLGSSTYHDPVGARSVRRTLGRRTRAVTFGPLHTSVSCTEHGF